MNISLLYSQDITYCMLLRTNFSNELNNETSLVQCIQMKIKKKYRRCRKIENDEEIKIFLFSTRQENTLIYGIELMPCMCDIG